MKAFWYWLIPLVITLGFVGLTLIGGCAPHPAASVAVKPPPLLPKPGQTPAELKHVAVGLDWIIVLAVIGLGVGIGLFFILPDHRLSFAIATIAAGIESTALVTRVSLWFVPWVAVGLAVLSGGILIYELYKNRAKIAAELNGAKSALVPLDRSSTAPAPVQLVHT